MLKPLFFICLVGMMAPVAATASLVAHWEMNENGGTSAANVANASFPGTLSAFASGSEWTVGPPAKASAVLFDGTDDIILTSYTGITGSAVRSLAAWVKYPGQVLGELDAIFSYGPNSTSARWTVRMGSGVGVDQHRLRLEISGAGVYGNTALNDNLWHHVAVVQTGATLGTVLLYVDGQPQTLAYNGSGPSLAINTLAAAGQEVAIGGSRHSSTYNWEGGLDDVRFYDHALSAAEVAALFATPPVIERFTALPGNLTQPGASAQLAWKISALPSASISISPTVGDVTSLTVSGMGNVAVTPTATTTYTLNVIDANGSNSAALQVGVNEPQLPPVINEIMAANDGFLTDEDGDSPDWIELKNPNPFAVDLGGYRLRDSSNDWVIPAGTYLSGQGHLVIFASGKDRRIPGQNLHTNFSLSSSGETLQLLSPGTLTVVESVPAGLIFPDNVTWGHLADHATDVGYLAIPTPHAANGSAGLPGPRIEKVITGLPEERSPFRPAVESGTIVADSMDQFSGTQGQHGWSYGWSNLTTLTYTSASFTPFPGGEGQGAWAATTQNWNTANTQWGNSWERGLTTAPNCDLGADYVLPSLSGGTSSPVRRWVSTFAGPAVLAGFFHKVGTGGDSTRWQVFLNGVPLLDSDLVTAGNQPVSVQASLRRYAVPVTLALGDVIDVVCDANASETSDTSRCWLRVWGNPESLGPEHDATLPISTVINPTLGTVSGATLFYTINFGPEQSLPMSAGTANAWNVSIPLAGMHSGDMIRWRIVATDSAGGTRTSPPFPSATDSPKYFGTVAADLQAGAKSHLRRLALFIENISASETTAGTRASLFWNGRFYDNLDINLHASSAYAKRSWDVDFNRGHRFEFQAGGTGHTDINILTNWRDRSKLRNPQSYHMFHLAGHPTLPCETVHLELNGLFHGTCDLTGELGEGILKEAGLDKNGALYKMQNMFRNYPADATSNIEKRSRKWEPGSADLSAYLNGLVNLSAVDDDSDPVVNNSPKFRFLADHTNLAGTVNFIAAMFFSTSYDWGHKNYALYRDSAGSGLWMPIPWDLDLSWGHYYDADPIANTYFDDVIRTTTNDGSIHNFSLNHNRMEVIPAEKNSLFAYLLEDPTTKSMILQRLRHLADQFLLETGPAPEIEGRIAALTDKVDPPGILESDADLDLRIWGYWNQHQTASNLYTPRSAREEVGRILNTFVPARRGLIFQNNPPLGASYGGPVPPAQTANPAIGFGTYDAQPASGNQDHEYIEIVNAGSGFVDLTGWKLTGGVDFTFPPGSVISPTGDVRFNGRLIVAKSGSGWRTRGATPKPGEGRMVLTAYDGQLSSAGESVELRNLAGTVVATLTVPPTPSDAQRWLRVTELYYHPTGITPQETAADPGAITSDFEFIELMNLNTAALDISGCAFTEGIGFTFPEGTILAPLQRIVVSRRPSALFLRHPSANPNLVLGPYTGNLDNGGERITLRDAVGEQIVSFVYDDKSPWPSEPDGAGPSLILRLPHLNPDIAGNWRASVLPQGNPLGSDRVPFIGDPLADADKDGKMALLEYALGTSDVVANSSDAFQWNSAAGTLSFDFQSAADDVEFIPEASSDLQSWESSEIVLQTAETVISEGLTRIYWDLVPLEVEPFRRYFRIRVQLRPAP